MRVTLIIATVERVMEFAAIINALKFQSHREFDVIVVDQNIDDRLGRIIAEAQSDFAINWIRSDIRNNSHARNLGLSKATGDIIGFPDDDCIYPPDYLAHVCGHFISDKNLAFLTGPSCSHDGRLGSGRWHKKSGWITKENIWTRITEFNFCIRKEWAIKVGGFDDNFGLGARYGSAEGVEMALRILKQGGAGFYDFNLKVFHPDNGYTNFTISRAYRYGTGLGQVLKKSDLLWWMTLKFYIRPLGGVFINIIRGNRLGMKFHIQSFRGRIKGFFS